MRRHFVCEPRELTQKVVQVGGHEFDDDAIDTGFAVLLDFLEDCVGVTLKRGIGVAVGCGSSDARHHPYRHLEPCLPAEFVDLGDRAAHLIWRSPETVPAVSEGRCALQCSRTITPNKDWDACGRSRGKEHVGIVDVLTVKLW